MSIIIPANSAVGGAGYQVANSCRFNNASNDELIRSLSSNETSLKKGTLSFWIKRAETVGTAMWIYSNEVANDNNRAYIEIDANANLRVLNSQGGADPIYFITDAEYRDFGAWSHFVIAIDTTQGTESNRVKIYNNGVQLTSFSQATYPSVNTDLKLFEGGQTNKNHIGNIHGQSAKLSAYLSEFVYIDGTQNAATDFGEFDSDSGIWKPIDVSGLTFGNNGFYLDFENSGALGADVSGNTNNFTVNNLTAIDQSTDTCTNNFATLNPLGGSLPLATFSDGNLTLASNTASAYQSAIGTIAIPTTGNWYWEYKVLQTTNGSSGEGFIGVALESSYNASSNPQKLDADGIIAELSGASGGSNFDAGDIASVEVDRTNNTLKIFKNGSSTASLTKTSLPNEIIFPYVTCFGSGTASVSANFGSPSFAISSGNTDGNGYGNFEYAVPSGYYSLNTKNLAEYG